MNIIKTSDVQEVEMFAWSPIAESVNGRSAIAGLLIALLIELTSHKPIAMQLVDVGENFQQVPLL